jgi:hypothetical protein
MVPYVVRYGRISDKDIALFEEVSRAIKQMPDVRLRQDENEDEVELSCHVLARAVVAVFPSLAVCDGLFGAVCEHSWVITDNGDIIDVYPVAAASGPTLLDGELMADMYRLFTPLPVDETTEFIDEEVFAPFVALVAEELRSSLQKPSRSMS